ncbi:SDR family oxidoreductase [Kribbella sandramycini]|uniref:NAD(P)-dependent dehydrogenase (Short-subunit alcohol dehydrogenase family) n=1 Tax=Kribbella sandramycini TaxID=60450 RepID=A0A7Y4KW04_9ACTN|nr:SDR family oxidoreductase [Kribbella sandramycini]MBB6567746.1 NAD(P)-dependent dehydrogenase (short-subunit alcohol dehydrogenase family) [Kribbella sandramycini]NOL39658.1 SDR family oxidoreductase [Kribbella sandramycini]
MNRLQNKVAIVTGAAGLLGLAGVRAMAREGAQVVMMDLSPTVHERAQELTGSGYDVSAYVGDVSSEKDMSGVVEHAKKTYGRLDIIWNNAGIMGAGWLEQDTDVVNTTQQHLLRTLEVNVSSVFLGSKFAIPVMLEGGGGSIINTSSIQGANGDTALISYGTSKAAIDYVTKAVATAYGHLGIRSNAVAPGLIPPPVDPTGPEWASGVAPQDLLRDSQLLDSQGRPEDIANIVVFLASDEAKFITGELIRVDGGLTAHLPTLSDRRKLAKA